MIFTWKGNAWRWWCGVVGCRWFTPDGYSAARVLECSRCHAIQMRIHDDS